jgi:formylglycine-generating enzyme required for sulfatase activity
MSVEMQFAWIPPGAFLMGDDSIRNEKPVHRVTLTRGFYMGVYPVTQAQWRAVMGWAACKFPDEDRPVEMVSWSDAQEFCEKLRGLLRKAIRLPTEAEWEYACRAGTQTTYSNSDDEDELGDVAWYDETSDEETHPVGELSPNEWGLYDMHGNVWEWCQDLAESPYPGADRVDPQGPATLKSPLRIVRGGAWDNPATSCRSAARHWQTPTSRFPTFGFRVCFTPD